MGKFKSAMRSISYKLTPTKRRASTLYPAPTPSPPSTPEDRPMLPSFDFEPLTPFVTPSRSPRVRKNPPVVQPHTSSKRKANTEWKAGMRVAANDVASRISSQRNGYADMQEWNVATHDSRLQAAQADVAASLAMLDFELKLPLAELGDIGRPSDTYSRGKAVKAPRTLWTTAAARDVEERGTGVQSPALVSSEQVGSRGSETGPARTLSLSSSQSSFSFACRDARRTERTYAQAVETSSCANSASFTPQDPSAVNTVPSPPHSPTNFHIRDGKHPSSMSDEEFNALPKYSDVEDDDEYDEVYVPDSDVGSVTEKESEVSEEFGVPKVDEVMPNDAPGTPVVKRVHDGSYASAIKEMELIMVAERLKAIQACETV